MSNEWFTPRPYIEAAREVLGEIDLDPASCEFANRTVQAKQYYTKQDNGLMLPWKCRSLWLNPPYGKSAQGGSLLQMFVERLRQQYELGNCTEAILLIPVNTATRWFVPLWQQPICFPTKRIRFNTENGPSDGAAFPTCLVYFGPNEQRFVEVFSKFGRISCAIDRQDPKPPNLTLWDEEAVS